MVEVKKIVHLDRFTNLPRRKFSSGSLIHYQHKMKMNKYVLSSDRTNLFIIIKSKSITVFHILYRIYILNRVTNFGLNLVTNFEMVENPVVIRCHPVVALVKSTRLSFQI